MNYVGKLVEVTGNRRGIVILESECKEKDYFTCVVKLRMTGAATGEPDEIHLVPNTENKLMHSDIKFLT